MTLKNLLVGTYVVINLFWFCLVVYDEIVKFRLHDNGKMIIEEVNSTSTGDFEIFAIIVTTALRNVVT